MQPAKPSSLLEGIADDSTGVSGKNRTARSAARFDPKQVAMAVGSVVALVLAGFLVVRATGGLVVDPGEASRLRTVVDSETGKVFRDFKIKDGQSWPWKNPSTGANTLYPGEACYWTKDGQAKLEPSFVILNEILGKDGDTLCPDCGRKVVVHNPMPPTELLIRAAEASKSGSN